MDNVVETRSFGSALWVVKLAKFLESGRKEFVRSKQILRSRTSIGVLVREADTPKAKPILLTK